MNDKRISELFKNPFYCGVLVHKSLEGKIIEGNQEKLISKEIFLKVNEVQSKNPHGYKMTVENKDISLKRFIRCEKAKAEKLEIEREIEKSKDKCSNLEKIIEAATTFASKFRSLWALSDYYRRQKLQFMLFQKESSTIRKKIEFEPQE